MNPFLIPAGEDPLLAHGILRCLPGLTGSVLKAETAGLYAPGPMNGLRFISPSGPDCQAGEAQAPVYSRTATMSQGPSFRHLLLVLQLGECSDLGAGCRGPGSEGLEGSAEVWVREGGSTEI